MVVEGSPAEIKYTKNYIGGQWIDGSDGGTRALIDPSTGEPFATVAEATAQDVDRAVDAAWAAYNGEWGNWGPTQRSRLLLGVAERLRADSKYLGALESLEVGKRLASGVGEVLGAADTFEYFASLARNIHGEFVESDQPWDQWVVREPYGVVAGIVPWNYPLGMVSWKLGPAIAAGNAYILKPSENTPLTALYLAQIFTELGAPAGTFNVVMGAGEVVGAALVAHPRIERIAFTGSTDTGRTLIRASADGIKKLSLELGGKSPNIVFADADWAAAMQGVLAGILVSAGQVCNAGSRVFVQRAIYEPFVAEMVKRMQQVHVGPGRDPKTDVPPLHSAEQLARVEQYVKIGLDEGAQLLVGGKRKDLGTDGYFFEPTAFGGVGLNMRIAQEEIFGPVVCLFPFDDEAEVIEAANNTEFGLAAAVWTNDLGRAHRMARSLKAGTVWINLFHPSPDQLPWGGYRNSGMGRELGHFGVEEYLQVKSVIVNLDKTPQASYGD